MSFQAQPGQNPDYWMQQGGTQQATQQQQQQQQQQGHMNQMVPTQPSGGSYDPFGAAPASDPFGAAPASDPFGTAPAPTPAPASHAEDDPFGFGVAPAPAAPPPPPAAPAPTPQSIPDDPFGLEQTPVPAAPVPVQKAPAPVQDDNDIFGFGTGNQTTQIVPTAQQSSPFSIFDSEPPKPAAEEENPFALIDATPTPPQNSQPSTNGLWEEGSFQNSAPQATQERRSSLKGAGRPTYKSGENRFQGRVADQQIVKSSSTERPSTYHVYDSRIAAQGRRNSFDLANPHEQAIDRRASSFEEPGTEMVRKTEALKLETGLKDVDKKQLVYAKELERKAPDLPPDASPLPDAKAVLGSGHILSRVSLRTILTKKWKQSYWVQYGPTILLLFRSVSDYQDWLTNPYHNQKVRNFLVKERIDFIEELSKSNVIGFQLTRPAMKEYERGDPMMWHFKLEKWMDYGATIAAAFASPDPQELDAVKKACLLCIRASRRGGDVAYSAARLSGNDGRDFQQEWTRENSHSPRRKNAGQPGYV